eukprot:607073-Prymnesium_polylepis.1
MGATGVSQAAAGPSPLARQVGYAAHARSARAGSPCARRRGARSSGSRPLQERHLVEAWC